MPSLPRSVPISIRHADSRKNLQSAQQSFAGEDESKEVTTPVYGDEICSKSAKKAMYSQICDTFQISQETVTHL